MRGRLQQAQEFATQRNAGHLAIASAGAVMALVACPMSSVAVAYPYWTGSTSLHGIDVRSKASLWTISSSMEAGPHSSEPSADICGEHMKGSKIDCGKIHAVRFFQITASLMALTSAAVLLLAFSPAVRQEIRPKLCTFGACITCVTLIWDFVSACVIASVNMPEPFSLNGAGFVFLILSTLLTAIALGFILPMVKRGSPKGSAPSAEVVQVKPASIEAIPNLLQSPKHAAQMGSTLESDQQKKASNANDVKQFASAKGLEFAEP